jgi:transcriptional regulator with XRE-family HTH domain
MKKMKSQEFSKKLKELRSRKGISQEELAQNSNLNLRTIQRIEAGDTAPRGDTLKRLALALDVAIDDLIEWEEHEDKTLLIALHLSALTCIAFPLLGIIVPFIIWILKRDKVRGLDYAGKKVINFQITFCLGIFLVYAYVLSRIFHINLPLPDLAVGRPRLIMFGVLILYSYNIIWIVINAIRSFKNLKVYYFPSIKFLR